jgi:hypothetical protein
VFKFLRMWSKNMCAATSLSKFCSQKYSAQATLVMKFNVECNMLVWKVCVISFFCILFILGPIPLAERSKLRDCGRSVAGIACLNPAGGMKLCFECCVLAGRGLCDGPMSRLKGMLPTVISQCLWSKTWMIGRPWTALVCVVFVTKRRNPTWLWYYAQRSVVL